MFKKLMVAGILAMPVPSYASPPMPSESIRIITAALPECTGGWIETDRRGRVFPMDLAPRLSLLSGPSNALDQDAGQDLYQIAKGLLAPATGVHDRMMDGDASLKCPAHAKEAVALMEYLVDEKPDAWRGATNAFEWLGLAYESGAAGAKNVAKARRYYLRFRIHTGVGPEARWSDGIDNSLLGNVERAGLRPYLDALAQSKRGGGAARLALAEAALPTDPLAARKWLRYLDDRPLIRLLELEDQKRIPVIADGEEIEFWAEASRTLFGYRKYSARLLKAAQQVDGGSIPTSAERPSIDLLRSHLDMASVADTDATRDPIPVRALVTPEGRAIWIEACSTHPAQSMPLQVLNVQLNAARLYSVKNVAELPTLPVVKVDGRPAYGWIILPAVHFTRTDKGKLEIKFANLPSERCVYSGIANAPPSPVM
ncbi:hypothetical protein NUTIK01_32790 [Novosphingobium sp. IK01]|uniref:Sel1 repeat family protein n=2 Tax=Novosphingobium pituita TaxID=3056842 RepID=A0ABQ6PD60_9SPHN|nr:hypothetical protein NUTIK01_32790 [Novosphingobium sp. IK01]